MQPILLPLHAGVALAGALFITTEALIARLAPGWRLLPLPILAGLAGAALLQLPRALGLGAMTVPTHGVGVDVLVGLLTANMGLHLTPRVLRQGPPVFALFMLGGAALYLAHNLNPPTQVAPIAGLLAPAFADPVASAQGMMMLGVLAGPFLAAGCAARLFSGAASAPKPAARDEPTPRVAVADFALRETRVVALVLLLVSLGLGAQEALTRIVPGVTADHAPATVLAYLFGGAARLAIERLTPGRFPEAALTALLLGPTMGVVLTYAILSVPLHDIVRVTPAMAAAGLAAMACSVVAGLLLFPFFARAAGSRYYGAVVATAFVAATTAWGPVAMAFLRRSTDERGEVEPMPAVMPLNAFYLFPWLVILATRALFAAFG